MENKQENSVYIENKDIHLPVSDWPLHVELRVTEALTQYHVKLFSPLFFGIGETKSITLEFATEKAARKFYEMTEQLLDINEVKE